MIESHEIRVLKFYMIRISYLCSDSIVLQMKKKVIRIMRSFANYLDNHLLPMNKVVPLPQHGSRTVKMFSNSFSIIPNLMSSSFFFLFS